MNRRHAVRLGAATIAALVALPFRRDASAALGAQIAALALPEGLLRQHHAARRVRVLATSGPTRSAYMPDVPSFVEQGRLDLVIKEWFAFFAPSGMPKDTVVRLAGTLQEAIARPELSAIFAEAGMTAVSSGPPLLAARIASEQRYWQPVLLRRHAPTAITSSGHSTSLDSEWVNGSNGGCLSPALRGHNLVRHSRLCGDARRLSRF